MEKEKKKQGPKVGSKRLRQLIYVERVSPEGEFVGLFLNGGHVIDSLKVGAFSYYDYLKTDSFSIDGFIIVSVPVGDLALDFEDICSKGKMLVVEKRLKDEASVRLKKIVPAKLSLQQIEEINKILEGAEG